LAFIALIAMASTIKSGSISLFTFAYNLQSVPVGIIGISYSVAAFPVLVKSFSTKDISGYTNYILNAARHIIFWSFPVIVLMIVLRAQIVRVVLGSNSFSWSDTRLTAASAALFVISLASQSLVLLFVRGYYAASNTKKPLIINIFSSVMIIVFAYLFIYVLGHNSNLMNNLEMLLRVYGVPGTMMLALPLAYACGSILNFFLIWFLFKRDFLKGQSSKLFKTFIQSFVGSIIMGLVAYFFLGVFDDVFNITTGRGIFFQGLFSGLIGISFGGLALYLMKNRELADLIKTLSHKFWKSRVIAPEQGEL
jgi:peptidoglycan biosynthesis protein MviN/MurJ (putative lipid II flippase)